MQAAWVACAPMDCLLIPVVQTRVLLTAGLQGRHPTMHAEMHAQMHATMHAARRAAMRAAHAAMHATMHAETQPKCIPQFMQPCQEVSHSNAQHLLKRIFLPHNSDFL